MDTSKTHAVAWCDPNYRLHTTLFPNPATLFSNHSVSQPGSSVVDFNLSLRLVFKLLDFSQDECLSAPTFKVDEIQAQPIFFFHCLDVEPGGNLTTPAGSGNPEYILVVPEEHVLQL